MKRFIFLLILVVLLAACSPASSPSVPQAVPTATLPPASEQVQTPEPDTGAALTIEFTDAANLRNQLAYGTLKLEGTEQAVSPDQARMLLPLWQAIVALSGDTTSVSEELTAVQEQITAAMKPEQIEAIAALKITNTQLNAYYAENGIVVPTPVPGVTKVPGSGQNISAEDKQATREAREASGTVGTGQMTKTVLFDKVVLLLTERAAN